MRATRTLAEDHLHGLDLVCTHARRFLDYLDALDADQLDLPVPGLDWTVSQTVEHVRAVFGRYTVDRRRAPTLLALIEQNAADVTDGRVDRTETRRFVEEQVAFLREVMPGIEPDRIFEFHTGQPMTASAGWGNLLGELHVHGDDIARATGRPFGVPGDDLEILWRHLPGVLDGWLRAEVGHLQERWLLRFPFDDGVLVLDNGSVTWTMPGTAAGGEVLDITDVAEFTLTFPYRRRPIVDPTVAVLASRFHDI
jgi:uncharacterized protein (TIGR03083 family)